MLTRNNGKKGKAQAITGKIAMGLSVRALHSDKSVPGKRHTDRTVR